MLFKDIIGQERSRDYLTGLFNSGRLPHALLFLSKEGGGGLPFAISLAQYILCENRTQSDACGECKSCKQVEKLAHPDLHLTFPTIAPKPNLSKNSLVQFREFFAKSPYSSVFDWLQFIKAENKQGNISAHECREIINQLYLTTYESQYKIQIIWRPEYLGKEGNILLKLIEEPPANTLIFLIAENEEEILKTILSRTQKIVLPQLSIREIAKALMVRFDIEERQALQIAGISQNNFSEALNLCYSNSQENDLMLILRDWFNAIFTFNAIRTGKWVDDLSKKGREHQKHFLFFAQEMMAHVLRMTLAPDYQPPLIDTELDFVKKLAAKNLPVSVFEKINDAIAKTIYHIERNAHSKTQLFYLSLQMQYLVKGMTLETVDSP